MSHGREDSLEDVQLELSSRRSGATVECYH
jgi:hypothetical protein